MNPYVDANGVPFNRLGIVDRNELKVIEYDITTLRIKELETRPVEGSYDLAHMQKIHLRILGDVFDYAGKVRTVNISKRDPSELAWSSRFATVDEIPILGAAIAKEVKEQNGLKGLDRAAFVEGITSIYVKVNYLHPFPEGNGRTTQTLLSQLAKEAGHHLEFKNIDPSLWNSAAARSMPQQHVREPSIRREGDSTLIRAVFDRIVIDPNREVAAAQRPPRAVAFEHLPHDQAVKVHPELNGAVRELAARSSAIKTITSDPGNQEKEIKLVRADIQDRLNAGKIPPLPPVLADIKPFAEQKRDR